MTVAVTGPRFPYLSVSVRIGDFDRPDFEFDVEPLVDTGFDGGVAVTPGTIPSTVSPAGESVWYLADGSEIRTYSYLGYVTIGHLPPVPTAIITLDADALLGRNVTDQFRVIFDRGMSIIVEP